MTRRTKIARSGVAEAAENATAAGYFLAKERPPENFISSGCKVLDCVLGGGFALGRIANVVGDKSTGKTLLMIEACANFAMTNPEGLIWYNEVEAAFDRDYAAALGLPVDRIRFGEGCFTVEDLFHHLVGAIEETQKSGKPGLYVLDSLDALSDRAELERDISDGSFGAAKAKKMSELFRRLVQKLESSKMAVLIVSQVRDAIGVTFGEKTTRSGGKALDFYASQALYLSQIKTLKRTIEKVERPVGIRVRARCKKNKIGLPLRECEFDLRFGFGVDDVAANLRWLAEEAPGHLKELDVSVDGIERRLRKVDDMPDAEYREFKSRVAEVVGRAWIEIERTFLPTRRKYT